MGETNKDIKFEQLTIENTTNIKNNEIKQKINISKGALLEYRMQRLMFHMGYYSKRGVIIKTSAEDLADEITDLDVYGIFINKDFSTKKIWADCKAGKAKPLERMSWIKGIKYSARIDEAIFVKNNVRINTKQYAQKSGILILDDILLNKLEKDFHIKENDWRGSWNFNQQLNMINRLKKSVTYDGNELKRVAQYMESNYWVFDYYARVKKCLSGIRQLYDCYNVENDENKVIMKWGIYELICLLNLAIINICREVYYLSESDKKLIIFDGMLSGEIPARKREEIVNATYKMAIGLVKQQIPDFMPQQLKANFRIEPPEYTNKLIDFVFRITNNPLAFFDMLRQLEFILMEYEFNEKEVDKEEMSSLFDNYDKVKSGIKTSLHFICEVCTIPTTFFKYLSSKL